MAINNMPVTLNFVLKFFYAMVNDQALDMTNEFYQASKPSEPRIFDDKKLSYKFYQSFLGYQPPKVQEIVDSFDPTKISK